MQDGDRVSSGHSVAATVDGPARAILTGERTALNFVQRLSGIASATALCVDAVAGTECRVLDTRKTVPGLRELEKYAVRCGGGHNHRAGLHDMVLIKDNHIALAGGVSAAIAAARAHVGDLLPLEVEVRDLAQLEEALAAGAKLILLDNMDPATLRRAVEQTDRRAALEASGGVTPANIREIARIGVDRVSLGWITHSAPALDVSLNVRLSLC
jgi:nicotinate-nucleotide pyrophosphorylase (carboxylating)